MFLAPFAWIVGSEWWEPARPRLTAGYDAWAVDYWRRHAPVPVKRSARHVR